MDVRYNAQYSKAKAQGSPSQPPKNRRFIVESCPCHAGLQVIRIEPANPEVIYVPSYNPTVVYGTWPYPAYPPAPYYPPGVCVDRRRHRIWPRCRAAGAAWELCLRATATGAAAILISTFNLEYQRQPEHRPIEVSGRRRKPRWRGQSGRRRRGRRNWRGWRPWVAWEELTWTLAARAVRVASGGREVLAKPGWCGRALGGVGRPGEAQAGAGGVGGPGGVGGAGGVGSPGGVGGAGGAGGGRGSWQHDPSHRQGVAYRDQGTAQRLGGASSNQAVQSREAYRAARIWTPATRPVAWPIQVPRRPTRRVQRNASPAGGGGGEPSQHGSGRWGGREPSQHGSGWCAQPRIAPATSARRAGNAARAGNNAARAQHRCPLQRSSAPALAAVALPPAPQASRGAASRSAPARSSGGGRSLRRRRAAAAIRNVMSFNRSINLCRFWNRT